MRTATSAFDIIEIADISGAIQYYDLNPKHKQPSPVAGSVFHSQLDVVNDVMQIITALHVVLVQFSFLFELYSTGENYSIWIQITKFVLQGLVFSHTSLIIPINDMI